MSDDPLYDSTRTTHPGAWAAREVEKLKDELAKRQRKLAEYEEEVFRLREEVKFEYARAQEVDRENARLQELVNKMDTENSGLVEEVDRAREQWDLAAKDAAKFALECARLREELAREVREHANHHTTWETT